MKMKIFITVLALVLAAGTASGQMMGSGQHMYGNQYERYGRQMMDDNERQSRPPVQPYNPYRRMMGSYGYGMPQGMMGYGYGMYPPGMMGGYGYGMEQNMMGYGMGPGMMGYGYGSPQGMMGYRYGMHPGMMGYGRGRHNMMGGYGMHPGQWGGCGWYPGATGEYAEKHEQKLQETQELRRKLHTMKFDYGEALRSPEISDEKKQEMEEEINEMHEKLRKEMLKE